MKKLWKSAVFLLVAAMLLPTAFMKPASAGYYGQLEFNTYTGKRQAIPETSIRYLAGSAPTVVDFNVSDYNSFLETIVRKYIARDQSFTVKLTSRSEVIQGILSNEHLWDEVFAVDLLKQCLI
jgi:hypothetical protein